MCDLLKKREEKKSKEKFYTDWLKIRRKIGWMRVRERERERERERKTCGTKGGEGREVRRKGQK